MEPSLRVLVVTSSSDAADQIVHALRRGGLEPSLEQVHTTDDLRAALSSHSWDAVVSDHSPPGFGAEVNLGIIRMTDPHLPFLVVSERSHEEDVVALMRSGANDYIHKQNLARLALAVNREVAEGKNRRVRQAAQLQAQQLAAIVSDADFAIISTTLDGVITTWNPGAERLYGYTAWEVIGRQASILLMVPDSADEMRRARATFERGESIPAFDVVRLHKSGARLDVSESLSPVRNAEGQVIGVSCIGKNISERKQADQDLRQTTDLLRAVADGSLGPVFVKDLSGRYLLVNPAAAQLVGRPVAEILGKDDLALFNPADAHLVLERDRRVMESGQTETQEEELTIAGVTRTLLVTKAPYRDTAGKVIGIFGISQDISERKAAERSVRASEERFRAFMDNSPAVATIKDKDSRLIYVNQTWRQQFDPQPTNWKGKTNYDFWPPESADLFRVSDVECLASNSVLQREQTARTPTGEERTWLVMKFPLLDDGQRLIGAMSWDITERKRSEDAVRLRDRAIQAATQGILITDPNRPDNPIIYASPGFERITGYGSDEILGRNCRFLQGPDTDLAAVAQVQAAIEAEQSCTVELLNYRKDGTPFWNELSISPVRDKNGRLTHFVGVQADVTDRRSLEEQFRQVQKMEAVGQLAAGVAHDFNNLLTIISGYSDMVLQNLPPGDPSRELVVEIHKAGERSAALTRQLLAFSRQQILAPRVLDLNEIVTDTEKMLRRLIGEDIELTTVLDPVLWAVRADSGQIEQVLMNLTVNARDAMPEGGRLTIETRNIDLDETYVRAHADAHVGPHVLLSVTDSGGGMPPLVRARIFEPFFTTKGPGKGTGLGLPTAYGIVKQSGGHIAVYSEVGIGTTFKIYLPRTEQTVGETKIRPGLQAPPRGTETLLLAEDDAGVRALCRNALLGCGYKVLEATNGDNALRIAAAYEGPIDLLITDVVMPGMGGRAVAEQMAERYPGLRVLFVSGYTDDAVIRHGVLREGVNFLQKPFSLIALAFKVREVLDAPR